MGSEIQRVDPETISSSSSTGNSTSTPASPAIATASSQGMHHCGATIAELAIFIDEHDVESGARLVLHTIRPTWRADHIQFKLFTDGITNKLVGCFHKPPSAEENKDNASKNTPNGYHHENSKETQKESPESDSIDQIRANTVLIRVYGNKTDMLIDRKAETRNIKMLHEYGFAPSLFATFKNGLAYEYVPGVTLKPETVVQEHIFSLVAKQMAEMHKVRHEGVDPCSRVPMIESQIYKFLKLIPQRLSDERKAARAEELGIPNVSKLTKEFDFLYGELKKLDSPIVFAHNDLLLGNVIYTKEKEQVTFIDYEYADYNYQAFDIGNHFTEFPGIDEVDFSLYPGREFQMKWLNVYLQAYLGRSPSDDELERLYVQVNQFALASHFLWLVWGLIQAEYSSIDFDFIIFASNRYKEYMKRRDEFLALKWIN